MTGESHSQSVLMSVRTDKGLAQYSKIQNCEEMGQVNVRNISARKNEAFSMLPNLACLL